MIALLHTHAQKVHNLPFDEGSATYRKQYLTRHHRNDGLLYSLYITHINEKAAMTAQEIRISALERGFNIQNQGGGVHHSI